jgi:hypothetical protein
MALGRAKHAVDVTFGQKPAKSGSKAKLEWARDTAEKIKRDYLK